MACVAHVPGAAPNGMIVAFRATAVEDYFNGLTVEESRHGFAGVLNRPLGLAPRPVKGRSVAEILRKPGHHGIHHPVVNRRGRGMVQIDLTP